MFMKAWCVFVFDKLCVVRVLNVSLFICVFLWACQFDHLWSRSHLDAVCIQTWYLRRLYILLWGPFQICTDPSFCGCIITEGFSHLLQSCVKGKCWYVLFRKRILIWILFLYHTGTSNMLFSWIAPQLFRQPRMIFKHHNIMLFFPTRSY